MSLEVSGRENRLGFGLTLVVGIAPFRNSFEEVGALGGINEPTPPRGSFIFILRNRQANTALSGCGDLILMTHFARKAGNVKNAWPLACAGWP